MLRKLLPLLALCALAGLPALAQETPAETAEQPSARQGWGFRVGYLKGTDIAERPVGLPALGGTLRDKPRLANSATFGALYYYEFRRGWRVELGVSLAPSKVEHVCPGVPYMNPPPDPSMSCGQQEGSVSTKVLYWDVTFLPHWDRGRFHLGVPFGVGWANLRANRKFVEAGWLGGQQGDTVSIDEDLSASGGMTYFLGLRPYWDLGPRTELFVEARSLSFHRLVSTWDVVSSTVEVTAGMTFQVGGKKKTGA